MIEIFDSARKHGYTDDEINYALTHAVSTTAIRGIRDRPTRIFIGHPHQGALENDYIEVGISQRENGTLYVFHAMRLSSKWQYLLYQTS